MKLVTVKFPKQYEQSLSALHDCIFKCFRNNAHCIAVNKFSVNDAQFNQKNSSNILVIYWNESNKNKHMPITFQWKPYIGCQKHAPNITKWQREKNSQLHKTTELLRITIYSKLSICLFSLWKTDMFILCYWKLRSAVSFPIEFACRSRIEEKAIGFHSKNMDHITAVNWFILLENDVDKQWQTYISCFKLRLHICAIEKKHKSGYLITFFVICYF